MSEVIKFFMTQEDVNRAFKWSRDAIQSQADEIHSLKAEIGLMKQYLIWIQKRATVLPYEESDIDQLKLNLSKIEMWAECALHFKEEN